MPNISEALARQAAERPESIALYAPLTRRGSVATRPYQTITFQQLQADVEQLAAAMEDVGLRPGMRTVLMVPPSVAFVQLTFALFHLGAVPVMVDPGMGLRSLRRCLDEAAPEAFVGITKAHVARILFRWGRSSIRHNITAGPRLGWGGSTLTSLLNRSVCPVPRRECSTEELAAILFTSGSTGVPKGAEYTHGIFTTQLERLRDGFQIEPGEVDLCTFPLFALFGPALGMTSVIPVMNPTRPALVQPAEILDAVERFKVTNLFGSPALLNRVASGAATRGRTVPLSSLRRVLSAGAAVAPEILERFQTLIPRDVQIYTPYGATESLPVAIAGSREILDQTRHQTAAGAGTCVGRPVPGLEVRIIPITDEPIPQWDDAAILPANTPGEIVVHGPQVTQAYFRRPDLSALAKIPDPHRSRVWHRMGDLGYLDELGRLWFCGRKSQRVVTEQGVLFTECVEGIFNTHPAVFRSALVGVGPVGRKKPVVCIELKAQKGLAASARLRDELRDWGRRYPLTAPLDEIRFHPRFPVDIRHNSKIFREKLAVWAARELGEPD